MRSVFIHHHLEDVLAAEVIAGALVSIAQVEIISYPPGPQVIVQTSPGQSVENVVIWTEDARAEPLMDSLLRGLAIRCARCTLLLNRDVPAPSGVIACECWPLFDGSSAWVVYRRALRSLLGDAAPQPLRTALPVSQGLAPFATRIHHPRIAEMLAGINLTPYAVVAGLLLLALMR